jgi:hypothetical protein
MAQNAFEVAGVMSLQNGGFAGYVAVPEPRYPEAQSCSVARHSGWQARVNQDDKGSRGVPIMPLMVVAGKDQGSA